jgi:hypothetical protein
MEELCADFDIQQLRRRNVALLPLALNSSARAWPQAPPGA